MSVRAFLPAAFVIVLAMIDGPTRGESPPAGSDLKFTAPATSGNLTIYLIEGPDRIKGKTFLTLEEALAQKKAIVHETKQVNELSIENVSTDAEIFVQAGDIVKGGQQDRVLAFDLIVPKQSGKVPIAAFCVEAGRWTGRPGEASGSFASSKGSLISNDLKIAAREHVSQQEVWSNVAKAQAALSVKLQTEVKSNRSASSLQLTLENKPLNDAIAGAVKELSALPDKHADAIGCAIAINGKVIGADTYASAALFRKLWPKLLKAAVIEAVAEQKKDLKFEAPDVDAVKAFLTDAEHGKSKERAASKRVSEVRKEGEKALLFESCDKDNGGAVLRQSYLTKTAPQPVERPRQPNAPNPRNDR